jgi:hypothetical protein
MTPTQIMEWIASEACVVGNPNASSLELYTVASNLESAAGHVRTLADDREADARTQRDAEITRRMDERIRRLSRTPPL